MTITVTHLLEDETKLCIQFSSTHATWEAKSRSDAIVGTAMLIGMGMPAVHFLDQATNAWQIQTFF
jgi:hypothetical protein